MYIKLESERPDLLAYRIGGKITTQEYDEIRAQLEDAIHTHGAVRVLVEVGHLRFPEAGVLWEDLRFAMHHLGDFKRFAVVGDRGWKKWWTDILGSLIPGDSRYFDAADTEKAWYWVQGD
jgi:hypothetical protein